MTETTLIIDSSISLSSRRYVPVSAAYKIGMDQQMAWHKIVGVPTLKPLPAPLLLLQNSPTPLLLLQTATPLLFEQPLGLTTKPKKLASTQAPSKKSRF